MAVGRFEQWVINAEDPEKLVGFWAFLLGGEPVIRPDGWAFLEAVEGRPRLSFQPAPDARGTGVRIHADIRVEDIEAATGAVVARGAERVGGTVTDAQGSFQVLRDPEGNTFCLVTPGQ